MARTSDAPIAGAAPAAEEPADAREEPVVAENGTPPPGDGEVGSHAERGRSQLLKEPGSVSENMLTGNDWQLRNLPERIEHDLIRSHKSAPAIERTRGATDDGSASASASQAEWGSARLTALTQVFQRAARVQESLSELVQQITEVADASQERMSLLLESLNVGDATRKDLQRVAVEASRQSERLHSAIRASDERIAELAGSAVRRIEDAAKAHADRLNELSAGGATRLEDAARGHQSRMERVVGDHHTRLAARVDELLSSIKREIDESRAAARKQHEAVRDEAARLNEAAAESLRRVEGKSQEHFVAVETVFHAQAQRLAERAAQEAGRIDEQAKAHRAAVTDAATAAETRLAALAERLAADLRKRFDERLANFAGHEQAAQQRVAELTALTDQCLARIDEAAQDRTGRIQDIVQQQLDRFGPQGKETVRLHQIVRSGVTSITTAGDEQVERLSKSAESQAARYEHAVDDKSKKLASQLQAASEAVRMLSDTTQGAHDVLNGLIENRRQGESRIAALEEACARAKAAADALGELHDQASPSLTALKECLEGSDATVKKIERLIEDVWTLTTTAQQRAHQLTKRCNDAAATGMKIESARKQADEVVTRLDTMEGRAQEWLERIERAEQKGHTLADQLAVASERATTSADATHRAAEAGDAARDKLRGTIAEAEQVGTDLETAATASRDAGAHLDEQRRIAEALTASLALDGEKNRTLAEELRHSLTRAERVAKDVEETLTLGAKIKEQLDLASAKANEVSRDTAQLLATLVERREVIESSDESLNEFLERVEQVRVRLQQLQTRADAFHHQLTSMLADPQRVIDEAKTQAAQLDGVCRAVRKVFSGLSQASLQANRDISRFTKISREANARLTQLSVETQRSGQTLREWVDEAAHAHSRLSKILAQVPPLSQTHPAAPLQNLADASLEAVPSIVRPLGPIRDRQNATMGSNATDANRRQHETEEPSHLSRPGNRVTGDKGLPGRIGTSDLSALIREAEEVAAGAESANTEGD